MEKLDKTFGKGSVMKLGDSPIEEVEVIPTGSITLDLALGVNGFPKGRIVEIYGPESSGKTTLAIHAIAECQKNGGIAAFIDAEHAFDQFYAKRLGVDEYAKPTQAHIEKYRGKGVYFETRRDKSDLNPNSGR
jgi:recombination protein RecA